MKGSSTVLVVVLGMVAAMATLAAGATIGIDVGLQGTDLPPINDIVQLLKSRGVTNVRIYDAATSVLSEFANQGIKVSVTVPNDVLVDVANSQQVATTWVQKVVPYVDFIDRIVVGNEWLHDSSNDASKLLPAMENIQMALTSLGLDKKVTTAHSYDIVQGYPPSAGTFTNPGVMGSILKFLQDTNSAIMVNIYPYFTYTGNTGIDINYALGNANASPVTDSGSGRTYTNLLDAQIDTVVSAMNTVGYGDVRLIIGESGWPSAGGPAASIDNARMYNQNLVQHVLSGKGSPLRPGVNFPTYIFALFNENQKPGDATEKNFGLYHPDMTPVYPVNLSVP